MAFGGKREGHLGIGAEETKSRLGLWYAKPSIGLYDNNSTSSTVSKEEEEAIYNGKLLALLDFSFTEIKF
ncbi:hypothetical protein Tco_1229487 [Tanacetum coccineum]